MADARGIRAGAAFVELFADDSALQKGLAGAEKSVKQFGLSVGKIGAAIGGLGAAITGPLIAATNIFANAGSALNDMSDRTGVSVQTLSALGFAAEQTGTSMETVEGGIRKMQRALTAGSEENQAAVGTFNALGLSIGKLMAMNPGDQFQAIAQRIAAIRNPTAQAGAALQIFGKSGTALLPMIKDLRALTQEAKAFDLIWTPEEAKAADALGDSISLLNQVIKRNIALVGGALAPSFTRWNMQMANISKTIGEFIKANQSLIVTISSVGFGLVAAGTAIVTLGTVIFGMGQIIGVVSGAISILYGALLLLTTPMGLVALGFVGMTTAMGKWGDLVEMVTDTAKDNFSGMLDTAKETFAGIADALKAGDIVLAAEVLWAGLKLEFIKGSQLIEGVWNDWTAGMIREMIVLNTDIASLWVDLWASMETIGTKAARKLSGILGMIFPDDPRISAAQEASGWQESLDEIEKNRKGTQDVLTSDLVAAQAEQDKANRARQAQAEDELFQAEMELAKRKKEAADKAAGPIGTGEGGMGKAPGAGAGEGEEPMTPEGLDKGLKEAASKVDVAGSFSAAAASGMGVGSSIEKVAKDHLDESKKQTKELERIKKNTAKQQVFAD